MFREAVCHQWGSAWSGRAGRGPAGLDRADGCGQLSSPLLRVHRSAGRRPGCAALACGRRGWVCGPGGAGGRPQSGWDEPGRARPEWVELGTGGLPASSPLRALCRHRGAQAHQLPRHTGARVYTLRHTHRHTGARIYTHRHTYRHTGAHAHNHTHRSTCVHVRTHTTKTQGHMHTHTHTFSSTFVHMCMGACVHTQEHMCMHTQELVCTHTGAQVCAHTRENTHTQCWNTITSVLSAPPRWKALPELSHTSPISTLREAGPDQLQSIAGSSPQTRGQLRAHGPENLALLPLGGLTEDAWNPLRHLFRQSGACFPQNWKVGAIGNVPIISEN